MALSPQEILIQFITPQILILILASGYIYLVICFFGEEKWKKFTDLDKIAFSFFSGFLLFYLFVVPLSWYFYIIKSTLITTSTNKIF